MTTSILINAVGQAIFESCGQALLVYIGLQLLFQLIPGIGARYRYDINYLGLTIITCWFLANLVKIYLHNATMAHYGVLIYHNDFTAHGIKRLPTLLQRADALIFKYAKYITGLYMIGLLLHSFRLIGGLVNIHQIRKHENLTEDSMWSAKIGLLAKNLVLVKKVGLYFSEHVQIPLTIGYLKPIIIFPIALINSLDNDQVEAILLHELAHIKRNDYLLNIVQCIMETILCFNPIVWLLSKAIRNEREFCCDDMVMEADYNNFTYSKALYIVAQQNNQAYTLAMASSGSGKYPLLNRIKRLNHMKPSTSLPKFHLLVIVSVLTIGLLLAWGIPQYTNAKTRAHHIVKNTHRASLLFASTSLVNNEGHIVKGRDFHPKKQTLIYLDTAINPRLSDTIKPSKNKFKIVIEDAKGDKKEYSSIQDLPAADRKEFLEQNPEFATNGFLDSTKFQFMVDLSKNPEWKKQFADIQKQSIEISKQFNTPAWKNQIMAMQKQFNSPEWKKQQEEWAKYGIEMSKKFNSPEWKKQVEDMKLQAEELSKKYMNSPEWKKQQEQFKIQAEEWSKKYANDPQWKKQQEHFRKEAEKWSKQYTNNPAWKKQVEDMKKQAEEMAKKFNSPEFKKQIKDLQDNINNTVNDEIKIEVPDTAKSAN